MQKSPEWSALPSQFCSRTLLQSTSSLRVGAVQLLARACFGCAPRCLSWMEENYNQIRLRLVGKHTPVTRRLLRRPREDRAQGDEADLRGLLDGAVALAEREHGSELHPCEAWCSVKELLPLLTQVQSLLLHFEHSRCHALEAERGRPMSVRFACYNASTVDTRPVDDDARTADHELLTVIADLIGKQRALVQMTTVTAGCRDSHSKRRTRVHPPFVGLAASVHLPSALGSPPCCMCGLGSPSLSEATLVTAPPCLASRPVQPA